MEYPESEDDHAPCGDSGNIYMEYELDSKGQGDC